MADPKMEAPKKSNFISEFKEFAMRGNLIDLAVGVIIGGAFGKLVTSFISDVIMPPIGKLLGNVDFKDKQILLQKGVEEVKGANGQILHEKIPDIAIRYGAFITSCLDFLIMAFVIFLVIKGMNRLKRKQAEVPVPPPEPTKEETLLTEIRDLLKEQRN
ncbi:MAG: large-conductance mechanosensitive channel protein MscL [Bacteroidota bacterium]|nr:large-conductance mechanosensitive channel protein MscL [Bacteroidota bacterium]